MKLFIKQEHVLKTVLKEEANKKYTTKLTIFFNEKIIIYVYNCEAYSNYKTI